MLTLALSACGSSGSKSDAGKGKSGGNNGNAVNGAGGNNGAGDGSPWCKLATDYQKQSSSISSELQKVDYKDKAKAKQQLAAAYRSIRPKFKAMFDQAAVVAPAEIKADLARLGSGLNAFMDELEKDGYDFEKLQKSKALTALADPKFRASGEKVGAYDAKHCGIPYTPRPSST
ncbi:MAG: hypothetical protein NVSMB57_03520 [Actinomycetota bacterium]